MHALVVVPTYNERHNLPDLVSQLLAVDASLDVFVVDDGSPDGTGELAAELARRTSRVAVLHREGKQGLGTAYVAGFRHALDSGCDAVVQMDADLSHRPQDLPRVLAAAASADVVVGGAVGEAVGDAVGVLVGEAVAVGVAAGPVTLNVAARSFHVSSPGQPGP